MLTHDIGSYKDYFVATDSKYSTTWYLLVSKKVYLLKLMNAARQALTT